MKKAKHKCSASDEASRVHTEIRLRQEGWLDRKSQFSFAAASVTAILQSERTAMRFGDLPA